MSDSAPSATPVTTSGIKTRYEALGARLNRITPAAIPGVAFLIGVAVMLMYGPMRHMEGGDCALYDYMAQCIVRGQVPYRDVIDGKGPASLYLSALVMVIGKPFGQDILAVRLFYVLLVGLLCVLTYLVAKLYVSSRIAAIIAFIIPLASEQLAGMMIGGTRPKLPMILFGLATLLMIAKDKPFFAGLCSMLSCLSWQPGLAFTGVALLMFSRYLTSWRDLRAIRVLAGAAMPLAIVIAYFFLAGALGDLWRWTVQYNYAVYMPEGHVPPGVALAQVWRLARHATGANIIWVKLSIAGWITYAAERLWRRLSERTIVAGPDLFKDAILIPPLIQLAFCVVNWQGEDGLIPFFPFVGIFAGYLVITIARVVVIPFMKRSALAVRIIEWAPIIPAVLVGLSVINHARGYRLEPGRTLQDQETAFKSVRDQLGPDDKIYVHGTLEVLVLLNKPNLNPYIFLDRGKDDYIASRLPGGFSELIRQMEVEAPKIISLSRLQNVVHRDELVEWAAEHYEKIPLEFAHNSVYVRKVE